MKQIFSVFLFSVVFALGASAQILEPVKWRFEHEKIGDNKYLLRFIADIDEGWYLYAQNIDEGGPIPTSFEFTESPAYTLIGKTSERSEKTVDGFDPIFEMEVTKFGKQAIFEQQIELHQENVSVTGVLEFMSCDDERCLPPEMVDFSFFEGAPVVANSPPPFVPSNTTNISLLGIFIAGFIGGIIALLTPCVFPMIPLTVSFFTKSSTTRSKSIFNSVAYGLSIIVIYVALGFIVTKLLGSSALNEMASNIWFNLAFFFIFIIFAISFFGAFELTLPHSFVNKMDSVSDKGGLIGIFFMAFTLALVSFSCTGPIIGTLLVEAAIGGGNLGPVVGMTGFAVALALPFGLFAAFPGWLNTLPKSGGWLNTVKVSLGFVELALALKFLSNVDMAYHWGFIKREIFIGIWALIGIAWALYLLGLYKFPQDSPVKKLSVYRGGFAALVIGFVIYLIPGINGANLKYLSGFPPPSFYSIWHTDSTCPHGISCFHDYEEGMAYARMQNKPVLIDFTGWSCVNCRKMEENVWIEPEIMELISDRYVLISLYVDDKTELKEEEKYVSPCSGKQVRSIGNKWSDFQACRFNTNSQPYYVLLGHDEIPLIDPRGYTPDKREYQTFLEEGLTRFNERFITQGNK